MFGLVHGLAFASSLPQHDVARPVAWLEAHPVPLLVVLALGAVIARMADRSARGADALNTS
jgi:hypothetical protein